MGEYSEAFVAFEEENGRLKRMLAEAMLDNAALDGQNRTLTSSRSRPARRWRGSCAPSPRDRSIRRGRRRRPSCRTR